MFESLSWLQVGFVALAAFGGSIAAGLSGMGGGMLLAVALAPIVGIEALIPVTTVTMLINHIGRVNAFHADVDWQAARRVMITALPCTAVGASVYAALPADIVAIVIGVFVLIVVPGRRLIGDKQWRLGTVSFLGVGGIFGFVSGAAVGAGMIIVPVLLGHGLVGATLIGTDAVIGLAVLIVKAATFGTLSVLSLEIIIFGTITGLMTIPGVYLARWIIRNTSVRLHTYFIEAILVLGGVSFIWRGLTS